MAILPRGHILLIPQPFLPAFRSEPSILHVFSCHRQPSNEQRQRYYSSKQPAGVFRCGFACLQSPSLWCHLRRDRARHRSASCLPRSNINRKPTSHQPDWFCQHARGKNHARSSGAEHRWNTDGGLAVDSAALQICILASSSEAREVRLSSILSFNIQRSILIL